MNIEASNLQVLSRRFPSVLGLLERREQEFENAGFFTIASRASDPTVYREAEGKKTFWLSQYNPRQEAANFISKFQDVNDYNHVLFYGAGLGYHIEEFVSKFPNIKYSIYEPEPSIFYQWMKCRPNALSSLSLLQNIFIETHPDQVNIYLSHLLQHTNGQIQLIVHPAYERFLQERINHFLEQFKVTLKVAKHNLAAYEHFQNIWVVNGTLNLRHTLSTPNYLQFKEKLNGKPVLIVSAGPSLQDEIENLRMIRQKNSAYIFAVGSANKSLINHGIMPHAVCAYDGSNLQTSVFKELIESGATDIPLFYGSYVGAMLLEEYHGPKIHFLMTHDTIGQFVLQDEALNQPSVVTSPTIAGVMLDVLCKLNCTIYFVGQNLALRNSKYYAEKIRYDHLPENVLSADYQYVKTLDVDGVEIDTTRDFLMMKMSIEAIKRSYPEIVAYNTTKGGAAIEGIPYRTLDEVIQSDFKQNTVDEKWFEDVTTDIQINAAINQIESLVKSAESLKIMLDKISDLLTKIYKNVEQRKPNKLYPIFPKFDAAIQELLRNDAYKVFLLPMNQNAHDLLWKKISDIKLEANVFTKGNMIAQHFGSYIYECQKAYAQSKGVISHLLETKTIEQKKIEALQAESPIAEVEVGGAV
ncbi:motility associated factor glycosyltransferase family protein [Cohnella hashimotonis]|uniref:DUF115 domain-containing protein n=1 Tax=Cohnella hashimotonis TaxID=2826895 RepID=A0ABT6TU35_9BACL|nr:6-hydroxymethylpterin diphosphokinase MptE-like protein [Cohnella hashimotonis]MDI4650355.1 DUF115 domain-containing protein [Cohnella hashimotonis]